MTMSKQLRAALALLGEERLVAFLRAAAEQDHPHAPRYMCRDLEAGATVRELFARERGALIRAVLEVERLAPRTFRITCGYRGEVGDGGTWRVVFTAKGAVQRLDEEGFWRH